MTKIPDWNDDLAVTKFVDKTPDIRPLSAAYSELRLPSFTFAAHEPYEWPRRE